MSRQGGLGPEALMRVDVAVNGVGNGTATLTTRFSRANLSTRCTSMTPKQQREEVSKAYVAAVAARCGYKLGTWTQDDDCLDVTVGAAGVLGGGTLAGPKLDLQLKASTEQEHDHPEHVAWSLSRAHYDNLRHDAVVQRLLVVLMLPEHLEDSVEHSADKLIVRRCAYWTCLRGEDEIEGDAASKTVHLPKTNVFSPDALVTLMGKVSREEDL